MRIPISGIKVNLKKILIFIFFFPFTIPNIVGILPTLRIPYLICQVWKVMALLVGVIYIIYVIFHKKRLPSVVLVLVCVFQVSILLSTIINRGDIVQAVETMAQTCVICFVAEYLYGIEVRGKDAEIDVLFKLFSVYMFIDLVCMIVCPHLTEQYAGIYGNKNNHIFSVMPLIVLLVMNVKESSKFWMYYFFAVVNIFLTHSATSCMALVAVTVLFIIAYQLKISNWLNMRFWFWAIIAVNFGIVTQLLKKALDVVIALLNKTATFGREKIWSTAWQYIKQSPIIGMGYEYEQVLTEKIRYTHMHNKFLDVLYTSGGIGLFFFILMLAVVIGQMMKTRKKLDTKLLFAALVGYFVVFMFEGKRYDYMFLVCIVIIYNHVRTMNKEKNNVKKISWKI